MANWVPYSVWDIPISLPISEPFKKVYYSRIGGYLKKSYIGILLVSIELLVCMWTLRVVYSVFKYV